MDENEIDRSWHPNFSKYVEFIVNHPKYRGLFYERKADNTVKWVVTGKSANGKKRTEWWNEVCKKLHIPIQKGCYAIAARSIHPTKKHVCQCCGKSLSVYCEYPDIPLLNKINAAFGISIEQTDYTIREIIENFCDTQERVDFIAQKFGQPKGATKADLIKWIYENISLPCVPRKGLSPGAMCNPPDRFDGFHSDGLCCRHETDKGRHDDNMKTYTQDRRAYEEWSDGDYNLANRLMGEFHKGAKVYECPICHKIAEMTADHIGPISLGFRHHKYFAPMCASCNSAKNNRFTFGDVQILLSLEQQGEKVISWHSKYIWDKVKNLVRDDRTAKLASNIMACSHQNILKLLATIYEQTGEEYLSRYLHPQYSLVDYRFEDFNPFDLEHLKIIQQPCKSKNKKKNQERYRRIAFESLAEFSNKDNRRNAMYHEKVKKEIAYLITLIQKGDFKAADNLLKTVINKLSNIIFEAEWVVNESN